MNMDMDTAHWLAREARTFLPELYQHMHVEGRLHPSGEAIEVQVTDQTCKPHCGMVFQLEQGFVESQHDAWILQILNYRLQNWLAVGFPRRAEEEPFPVDPITNLLYEQPQD